MVILQLICPYSSLQGYRRLIKANMFYLKEIWVQNMLLLIQTIQFNTITFWAHINACEMHTSTIEVFTISLIVSSRRCQVVFFILQLLKWLLTPTLDDIPSSCYPRIPSIFQPASHVVRTPYYCCNRRIMAHET